MFVWISLVIVTVFTVYWYLTRNFKYWKVRNVAYDKPYVLTGNLNTFLTKQISLGEYLRDVYEKHPNEPYVGIFLGSSPCLVIRDYELTQQILHKDTEYFGIRISHFEDEKEPILAKMLFSLGSSRWKSSRQSLSPGFTGSKLKHYFNEMSHIVKAMNQRIESNPVQNISELTWCFAVDSISHSMFGLNSKSMLDPDDKLLQLSKELFSTKLKYILGRYALFSAPQIYSTFRLSAFSSNSLKAIKKMTCDLLTDLDTTDVKPNNMMGMIHKLMAKETEKPGQQPFEYNEDAATAQVTAMMIAGTETTTSSMIYAMYELCQHQDIQEKLRQEVLQEFPGGIDTMTYEGITNLKYLQMVIMETLRMHPAFPFVDRVCTKDYTIPGTNCTINKGVYIFTAMWGLHMDEKYWKDPEMFIPERFQDMSEVNKKPFFPFSIGNRACIGMKFAMQEMQLLLASLVSRWRWSLAPDTKPLRCDNLTWSNIPDKPLYMIFEEN